MRNDDFTLSRKDLIKIGILTLVLPLPVNWALLKLNPITLMDGANDVSTWIGFGGSYIGGIIGGVISILILNRTLQQTVMLHRDLKVLQLNTIRYTQQQEWFVEFKANIAANLKTIDLYVLNMVVSCLAMKDFPYAKSLLTEVNKRLEQQTVMLDFLFPSATLQQEENKYLGCMRRVCLEYSALIRDLLYYIPLAEAMEKGMTITYERLMDYTMSQYDYLKEQNVDGVEIKDGLCAAVLELNPDDNIRGKLTQLVEIRLTMRSRLYQLKAELAKETEHLTRYEEARINNILTGEK